LVGAAHEKGIQLAPLDEMTGRYDNKITMGRGLLRYEEDYDAMCSSYEGKIIIGLRDKGGKRETRRIYFR
jgi:hypothetical protein